MRTHEICVWGLLSTNLCHVQVYGNCQWQDKGNILSYSEGSGWTCKGQL